MLPKRHTVIFFRHVLTDCCGKCSGTLKELFEEFAEQPVASGSIAQIHKARLSVEGARGSEYPPGTVVAVKVLLYWYRMIQFCSQQEPSSTCLALLLLSRYCCTDMA